MNVSRAQSAAAVICFLLVVNLVWVSFALFGRNMPFDFLCLFTLLALAAVLELCAVEVPYYGYVSVGLPVYLFAMMYSDAGGWGGALLAASFGILVRTFIKNNQPMLYKIADLASSLLAVTIAVYAFTFVLNGINDSPLKVSIKLISAFEALKTDPGSFPIEAFTVAFIASMIAFFAVDFFFTVSTACFLTEEHMLAWNKIRNKIRLFYCVSFAVASTAYFTMAYSPYAWIWIALLIFGFYKALFYVIEEVSTMDSEQLSQDLRSSESRCEQLEKSSLQLSVDLKKKIDEISVLYEMAKAIGSSINLESAVSITMAMVRKFVRYQSLIIFLFKKGVLSVFKADSPYRGAISSEGLPNIKETIVYEAVQMRMQKFISEDQEKNPEKLFENEISAICIPFLVKEKILGALYIGDIKSRAYHQGHLNILSALSVLASIAIDSAQLYQEKESSLAETKKLNDELTKNLKRTSMLNELGKYLGTSLKVDDNLDFICSKIKTVIDFQTFVIFVVSTPDKDSDDPPLVIPKRVVGPYAKTISELSFKHDKGILGWVIANKKPVRLSSEEQSEYPNVFENEKSSLIAPMLVEDKVTGIFYMGSAKENFYDANSLNLISTIAYQTAMAMKNAELYESMVALAISDGLTGLYTHRYFQERLVEFCKEYERSNKSFSLIMIDTDHFKSYNDAMGHPEGDKLLKEIAGLIKSCCRDADLVARYGGDEFVVILKESDKANSVRVAERIREAFLRQFSDYKVKVTASIGVATFPEDAVKKEELIVAVDNALYESKKNGRNRVTCAPLKEGEVEKIAKSSTLSKTNAMNKTNELNPAQLFEMRQSFFHEMQSHSSVLLSDDETEKRASQDSSGRFHVPDAPSAKASQRLAKSETTQVFQQPSAVGGQAGENKFIDGSFDTNKMKR